MEKYILGWMAGKKANQHVQNFFVPLLSKLVLQTREIIVDLSDQSHHTIKVKNGFSHSVGLHLKSATSYVGQWFLNTYYLLRIIKEEQEIHHSHLPMNKIVALLSL